MIHDYTVINKQEQERNINFLLLQYFNFETNDDVNVMLKRIVKKAYEDATGEGAFNTLIPRTNKKLRELADKCAEQAQKKVIDELLSSKNNFNYRTWHTKLCDDVLGIYSEVNEHSTLWSFGNSQKIVNMSVKYLLLASSVICLIDETHSIIKIAEPFKKIKQSLDIPVDSFMLEALWGEQGIAIPYKDGKNNRNCGAYGATKAKSWSNWDKETYRLFQESYHKVFNVKKIVPLDWEAVAWIAIAKKRRKLV